MADQKKLIKLDDSIFEQQGKNEFAQLIRKIN